MLCKKKLKKWATQPSLKEISKDRTYAIQKKTKKNEQHNPHLKRFHRIERMLYKKKLKKWATRPSLKEISQDRTYAIQKKN